MVAVCFVVTLVLWCESRPARAQQDTGTSGQAEAAKPTAEESTPKTEQRPRPIQAFRLDFSLVELEDGKKINSRHYSINLTAGSANEVKIGTRVPIGTAETNPAQFQYLDVGTMIFANLRNIGDELQLEVRSDSSWTKHEDVDVSPRPPHSTFTPPIVSQIQINGSTLLVVGKPLVIGSVDDPYSKRQFQLEVTVTKLK
jgi:hypothetical protein